MNKVNLHLTALFLLLLISACSEDTNAPVSEIPNYVHMKCDIDGIAWESDSTIFRCSIDGPTLSLYGSKTQLSHAIAIYVRNFSPDVLNYELGDSRYGNYAEYTADGGIVFSTSLTDDNAKGNIEIIEYTDTYIKGRFSITPMDNESGNILQIKNGTFYYIF